GAVRRDRADATRKLDLQADEGEPQQAGVAGNGRIPSEHRAQAAVEPAVPRGQADRPQPDLRRRRQPRRRAKEDGWLMRLNLQGILAATFTALRPDGSLNLDLVESQAEALLAAGVRGAFV